MAPGTEAPAEMHFYFPRYRALCMAENATHNLHNLLTLRGALVRDPHGWSGYLTEAIDTFADRADVVFASHHWPTWGTDSIVEFLSLQRDLYAYLHDQTLRLLNQGYTGVEIAENFQMPPALQKAWHTHGYYGSVSHNVKADLPALHGLVRRQPRRGCGRTRRRRSAPRYVEAIGGVDRVVELARRPSIRVTSVGRQRYSTTSSSPTRTMPAPGQLYADTLEQTGLRRRVRDVAQLLPLRCHRAARRQLRHAHPGARRRTMLAQLTPEQMFDVLAISVNGPRAWDLDIALDVTFADLGTNYRLTLRNGVLVYRRCPADESTATVTVRLASKLRLLAVAAGDFTSPGLETTGDAQALQTLLGVLDQPDPGFNIITP